MTRGRLTRHGIGLITQNNTGSNPVPATIGTVIRRGAPGT